MIEFEGVTHRYDGRQRGADGTADSPALDDVSLTIDDGEYVVLAGANGSGKTTLVRHCNALLEPDEGVVRVDGTDVAANPVVARTSVGMVFQHPRDQFVAATVGADVAFGPENLGLDRHEIDDRVERALQAVNMADRADERISSLSGGEQARVAIAGVLAMEPSHLILDEPLTGLDLAARESVLAHLDELSAAGTGIVLVTHDLRDLIERADRIVGMVDGWVALDGPPESVVESLPEVGVRAP